MKVVDYIVSRDEAFIKASAEIEVIKPAQLLAITSDRAASSEV
jgi:hypothetical protein